MVPKIITPKPTLEQKARPPTTHRHDVGESLERCASVSHFGVAQDLKMAERAVRRSKEGPGWVLRRS